jgi:hypothetical protein
MFLKALKNQRHLTSLEETRYYVRQSGVLDFIGFFELNDTKNI